MIRREDAQFEFGAGGGVGRVGGRKLQVGGVLGGQDVSADFCQTCDSCFSFRHTKCLPAVLPTTILNRFRKRRALCRFFAGVEKFFRT